MHDFDRYPFQFDWFSNPVEKILLTIYNVPWLIQPKNFQKEHYLVNAQGAQTGGYFLATWSERIPQTVEKCSNDVKAKDHCQRGKCQKRQTGLDHVQGLFSWKKGLCIILFLWSTHSCNHEHFAYRRFSCDHLWLWTSLLFHQGERSPHSGLFQTHQPLYLWTKKQGFFRKMYYCTIWTKTCKQQVQNAGVQNTYFLLTIDPVESS